MLKRKIKLILVCLSIIIVCIFLFIITRVPDLSIEKITDIKETLVIYDGNNNVCTTINAGENRKSIDISAIPSHIINALISTEDIRFYEHNGIDIKRIFGAIIADIKAGSLKEGASTITQQLIKNSHLTNEKTFLRKFNEMILALQLERRYEKEEILEMYLNFVYFGRGAYGIEAAAQSYFGKSAQELSCSEGALLIGVLKAPGKYAPHINMEKAKSRRNVVLQQMCKYGFISEEENETYKNESIIIVEEEKKEDYGYYTDYVLNEASDILGISISDLMASGYSIYTYQDSQMQSCLQEIYSDASNFPSDKNGEMVQSAAVVLDNKLNAITAMVGGREHDGMLLYNRASARRQPGSCIKPILVYAPAFEENEITCATIFDDYRKDFDGYTPSNFKDVYYGRVTVRQALSLSLNVPAVEILNNIGIDKGKEFAQKLGVKFDSEDKYLALALGGMKYGISCIELASAYSAFANNGEYADASTVSKITDSEGNVIYERNIDRLKVFSDETTYLITDILRDVAKFSSSPFLSINNDVACKTGTVGYEKIGYSDAWTVAYSTKHTVAVWLGFDKTTENTYLYESVTGSAQPMQISSLIFENLTKRYGKEEFTRPESVVELDVDLNLLKNENRLCLAGDLTSKKNVLTECFNVTNMPNESEEYWNIPKLPLNINVGLDELRRAEISLLVNDWFVEYEIYRIRNNEETCIKSLSGNNGELVTYTDTDYIEGDEYYILPVHKEITHEGRRLSGEKSKIYGIR